MTGPVYCWERTARALRLILARLFWVPWCKYVDDLFAGDVLPLEEAPRYDRPPAMGPGGESTITRAVLTDLLGWDLDAGKRVEAGTPAAVPGRARPERTGGGVGRAGRLPVAQAATEACIQGVQVAFSVKDQAVRFSIGKEKADKWLGLVRDILRKGGVSPAAAGKLAGSLSWGASSVFGRGARVYLAPLYWHAHRRRWAISGRLRLALIWWVRYLAATPVRVIPVVRTWRERVVVYTDATGGGNVAWVIDAPWGRTWAAASVPRALRRWVLPRRTQVV